MKLLVIDNDLLARNALASFYTKEPGFEIAGLAATGREGLEAAGQAEPDLIALDLMLPDMDGFEVASELRRRGHRPKLLAISARCDAYTVYRVEQAQFFGFVLKRSAVHASLREATDAILTGRPYFSLAFREEQARRRRDANSFVRILTEREQTVLSLVASLMTDEEIAQRLQVSPCTPEKHRLNILRKLGLGSRIELIRYAHEQGFAPMTPCPWNRKDIRTDASAAPARIAI